MIPAAEDYAVIRARMTEIAATQVPVCPYNNSTSLYTCLRSSARCAPACPMFHDWIGPQP